MVSTCLAHTEFWLGSPALEKEPEGKYSIYLLYSGCTLLYNQLGDWPLSSKDSESSDLSRSVETMNALGCKSNQQLLQVFKSLGAEMLNILIYGMNKRNFPKC